MLFSMCSLIFSASGEDGELKSKKDFIMTARNIAKESDEVVKMAMMVAEGCTDRRMKRVSDQLLEYGILLHARIPIQ